MASDEEWASHRAFGAAQTVARYELAPGTVAQSGLAPGVATTSSTSCNQLARERLAYYLSPDRVGTVLSLVPDVPDEHGRIEWLRFVVPPGAVRMHLKLHGGATVYLDGVEQQPVAYADVTDVTVMEVNLSAANRVATSVHPARRNQTRLQGRGYPGCPGGL